MRVRNSSVKVDYRWLTAGSEEVYQSKRQSHVLVTRGLCWLTQIIQKRNVEEFSFFSSSTANPLYFLLPTEP